MRVQDEVDFSERQQDARRFDAHQEPLNPLERTSNKRAARFLMNMAGVLALFAGFVALGFGDTQIAMARAVVGFCICVSARFIFPTD